MPRPMLVPAQDSITALCCYLPILVSSPEYKPRVGRPLKDCLSVCKSQNGAIKSPDLPLGGAQCSQIYGHPESRTWLWASTCKAGDLGSLAASTSPLSPQQSLQHHMTIFLGPAPSGSPLWKLQRKYRQPVGDTVLVG